MITKKIILLILTIPCTLSIFIAWKYEDKIIEDKTELFATRSNRAAAKRVKHFFDMSNIKYSIGDNYEVVRSSTKGLKTNYIAIISIFLILSSFLFQNTGGNSISGKSVSAFIYQIIWFISFVLPLVFFTIKFFRYKEIDLYLVTLILLIMVSYLYITFN